jgi:hypothetical protein
MNISLRNELDDEDNNNNDNNDNNNNNNYNNNDNNKYNATSDASSGDREESHEIKAYQTLLPIADRDIMLSLLGNYLSICLSLYVSIYIYICTCLSIYLIHIVC